MQTACLLVGTTSINLPQTQAFSLAGVTAALHTQPWHRRAPFCCHPWGGLKMHCAFSSSPLAAGLCRSNLSLQSMLTCLTNFEICHTFLTRHHRGRCTCLFCLAVLLVCVKVQRLQISNTTEGCQACSFCPPAVLATNTKQPKCEMLGISYRLARAQSICFAAFVVEERP